MLTNKYKQKISNQNIEASFTSNYLSIPSGSRPQNIDNLLYNIDGNLFWGNVDLTAAATGDSRWSLSKNKTDIFYNFGKIGIKTDAPLADLDVNGKIKTKELQIGNSDGFLISKNGNVIVKIPSSNDFSDFNISSPEENQIIIFENKKWTNKNINQLNHSLLDNLNEDAHQQYLNEERHNSDKHNILSLNVNDILIVDNAVYINAPLVLNDTITINQDLVIKELCIENLNGVLIARDGKISSGVTTTDIPEGKNLYYNESKVLQLIKSESLSLDGSNIERFTGFKKFVSGLDADKLDGKEASYFAEYNHKHNHDELINISPNDHHEQKHNMVGQDHQINGKIGQFVKIIDNNIADFSNIEENDLPQIPFNKIGNGEISGDDIYKLRNIKSNIQDQINNKSDLKHQHAHKDLEDLDKDDHKQYFNENRINEWIKNITTDDIKEGKNLYFSSENVQKIADEKYLRVDGENSNLLNIVSILNINADKLDGFDADYFAKSKHEHDHSDLKNISPNDHHKQKHNLISDDHIIEENTYGFLKFNKNLEFCNISIDDIPNNIPASKISDGKIDNNIFSYLFGVKSNIQDQIDNKSMKNHTHTHKDLLDLDKDYYNQYYNKERIEKWFENKTTDNIKEGNNKFLSFNNLKDVLSIENPLYWNSEILSFNYDVNTLKVSGGKLTTIQDISLGADVSFKSLTTSNVYANKIGINVNNPKYGLEIIGGLSTDSLRINLNNGILKSFNGLITSSAKLSDLEDINLDNVNDGDVLFYNSGKWNPINLRDIVPAQEVEEYFNENIHSQDEHNINQINVNNGTFKVYDNNVYIGENSIVDFRINGEFKASGLINLLGDVSLGSYRPRAGLDLDVKNIVAGPQNIFNSFTLFDNSDNSANINLYNDVKFKFNSIDSSDGIIASFDIVHDGIVKISALKSKDLIFEVGDKSSINFSSGGVSLLTISNNDYIGIGTSDPLLPVDTRSFFGIANQGMKPNNWMIFRTDISSNNPIIAFPQDKKMLIGTYDHYAINGIWKELVSIDSNEINIKSKKLYIDGEFNQSIIRKKILETENNDIDVSGSNIIKFTSSKDDFIITGINNGFDGKQVIIINGTYNNMILKFEDNNSKPENRIYKSDLEKVTVASKNIVKLLYDQDEKRWFIIN